MKDTPRTKQPDSDGKKSFARIVNQLTLINQKLDLMIEINSRLLKMQEESLGETNGSHLRQIKTKPEPDVMTLLTLPMALRKTVMALYKLEDATAADIAKVTQRLRAVESASANQLARMGYIKKKRVGRKVYFYIEAKLGMK